MQTSNVESRLNDRIGGLDILIGKELQSQPVAVLMLQPMYGYLYLLLADRLGCRLYVELENALGEPAKPVSIANKDIHNGVRGCMHDDLSLHFEVSIYGDAYKRFSDNFMELKLQMWGGFDFFIESFMHDAVKDA